MEDSYINYINKDIKFIIECVKDYINYIKNKGRKTKKYDFNNVDFLDWCIKHMNEKLKYDDEKLKYDNEEFSKGYKQKEENMYSLFKIFKFKPDEKKASYTSRKYYRKNGGKNILYVDYLIYIIQFAYHIYKNFGITNYPNYYYLTNYCDILDFPSELTDINILYEPFYLELYSINKNKNTTEIKNDIPIKQNEELISNLDEESKEKLYIIYHMYNIPFYIALDGIYVYYIKNFSKNKVKDRYNYPITKEYKKIVNKILKYTMSLDFWDIIHNFRILFYTSINNKPNYTYELYQEELREKGKVNKDMNILYKNSEKYNKI
jgi:hypothetical protein